MKIVEVLLPAAASPYSSTTKQEIIDLEMTKGATKVSESTKVLSWRKINDVS